MLAASNAGTSIQPLTETTVVSWTSDGQYFLGFMGTGTYSGLFKLSVKKMGADGVTLEPEEIYYVYSTSPSNRTAYVVDRVEKFPLGSVVELRVLHDSAAAETFYGTLLGGMN